MTENEPVALEIWTVYDHPRDMPNKFVAREWRVGRNGTIPTGNFMACDVLDELRGELINMRLTCLARAPNDDPVIVECWI